MKMERCGVSIELYLPGSFSRACYRCLKSSSCLLDLCGGSLTVALKGDLTLDPADCVTELFFF